LKENHIHMFFLKSNDLSNDQPNDLGINAKFKSYYNDCLADWYETTGSVVGYTRAFFNTVVKRAWELFRSDPDLERVVKKAFEKARLFPLVDVLHDPLTSSMQRDVLRQERISAPFHANDHPPSTSSSTSQPSISYSTVPTTELVNMTIVDEESYPTIYSMVIAAYSKDCVERTLVKPAHETVEVMTIKSYKHNFNTWIPCNNRFFCRVGNQRSECE
jgi:hypothetical protein